MWFEDFQGGHLGYRNRTILGILNLYVAPMPPIKFRLNPTYGWEITNMAAIFAYLNRNYFSNSESLCCSNASDQVSPQSAYGLEGDVV